MVILLFFFSINNAQTSIRVPMITDPHCNIIELILSTYDQSDKLSEFFYIKSQTRNVQEFNSHCRVIHELLYRSLKKYKWHLKLKIEIKNRRVLGFLKYYFELINEYFSIQFNTLSYIWIKHKVIIIVFALTALLVNLLA